MTKEQNQALVEPLGPIYMNFQNWCPNYFVNEPGSCLRPTRSLYIVYWLRPRAWFVTKEQNQALVEPLGPNTTNFPELLAPLYFIN